MSQIPTFILGRHPDCDLMLEDNSVSRRHAEVVAVADGRYYITDRASSGGTFVRGGKTETGATEWRPIRQGFVKPTDSLRLGYHELPVARLGALRRLTGGGGDAGGGGVTGGGPTTEQPDDGLDPSRGLVRDPETGEIVEQS